MEEVVDAEEKRKKRGRLYEDQSQVKDDGIDPRREGGGWFGIYCSPWVGLAPGLTE